MTIFKYKAVVFDLDGTLLDTLEDLYLADNYVMSAFGFPPVTKEQVASYMGNGIKQLLRLSVPRGEDNPFFNEAYNAYLERYIPRCDEHTRPYDGIIPALKILKESGVRAAVVSNKNHIATSSLCKRHFGDLIDVAIGENEAAGIRKKPYPDTVFSALEAVNVKVDDAVYVGDTEVDIETAKNCGAACVSVLWGFRSKEALIAAGADKMAASAEELIKILAEK